MKDWKVRQHIYHALNPITDYIDGEDIVQHNRSQLVQDIVDYFTGEQAELVYPAKSYAVAIIYAQLLNKYFGEDFWNALDDPDLLFGNDRFFVPFSEDPQTYKEAFAQIDTDVENLPWSQVRTTISYFKEEFMLV